MVRLQAAPRNLLHRRVTYTTTQHTYTTKIVAREPMIYTVRKIRHSRLNPSRHCYTCARACACAENVCSPSFARIKQWTTPVTTISINYTATDRRLAFPRTSITCRSLTRRETWPRSLSSDESPLERRVCIERRLPPRKNWSNILAGGGSAIVAVRQRS